MVFCFGNISSYREKLLKIETWSNHTQFPYLAKVSCLPPNSDFVPRQFSAFQKLYDFEFSWRRNWHHPQTNNHRLLNTAIPNDKNFKIGLSLSKLVWKCWNWSKFVRMSLNLFRLVQIGLNLSKLVSCQNMYKFKMPS